MTQETVAVVGAGIVGLAHAWSAARRGARVLLLERDRRAMGASIRNFGMVWPIGQTAGHAYQTALASRQLWRQAAAGAGFWHRECGSLHLAYREDEWQVLHEFAAAAEENGYRCELIDAQSAAQRSPAVRRENALGENLLGALWSDTEMCVDPREAIARLPHWLAQEYGVELHFGAAVTRVEAPWLIGAAEGERWRADRILICSGADLRTLLPEVYAGAGIQLCKLQMMRTPPQARGWRIGPHLAGGLTLRHYESFRDCPSLPRLKERIAAETPELDCFGIHVMASQNEHGEVIVGDSHEYGDQIAPFDKQLIDELILREIRRMIDLPDWTIQQRWHGVYAKLPGRLQFTAQPQPNVHVITATGGAGMTMSFGLAEEFWEALA